MKTPADHDRFAEALNALLLGAATEEQKAFLEARMSADPAALEEYERQLEIHTHLKLLAAADTPAPRRRFRPLRAAALIPLLLLGLLAAAGTAAYLLTQTLPTPPQTASTQPAAGAAAQPQTATLSTTDQPAADPAPAAPTQPTDIPQEPSMNAQTHASTANVLRNAALSAGLALTLNADPVNMFDEPLVQPVPGGLSISVDLLDAGDGVDVSLWFGGSAQTLAEAAAWPGILAPASFTFTTNLPAGTYYGQFNAATSGISLATTAVFSAVPGNPVLIWDNHKADNAWDTTTANWHHDGDANGSALFSQGDSVAFTANANPVLREDITAGDISVAGTWTLYGAHTLDILGDLLVQTTGTATINESCLAGPGSVTHNGSGTLVLGYIDNYFAGSLNLLQGKVTAKVIADVATQLGAGEVRLGADIDVASVAYPTLEIIGDNNGLLHILRAGDLVLTGGGNAARIVLNSSHAAADGITAHFTSLRREPGASLAIASSQSNHINPGGLNEKILFDTPPATADFPPWAVIEKSPNNANSGAENGGNYVTYDPVNGLTRRILTQTAFAPGGINDFVLIQSNTTLADDASATAVQIAATLNLGGNTLYLGSDECGGLLFKTYFATITNGRLDLGGNDLYVFSEQGAPVLGTGIFNAPSLRKFGTHTFYLNTGDLPPLLVAQAGIIGFNAPDPVTYTGQFRGVGALVKEGAQPLTFTGNNTPVKAGSLEVKNGGVLRIHQGDSVIQNAVTLDYVSTVELANATLSLGPANFMIGKAGQAANISRDNLFHVLPGGILRSGSYQVGGGANGVANTLRIDGGLHLLDYPTADVRIGGSDTSHSNRVEIINGGRYLYNVNFSIGYHGSYNAMVVSNNATASMATIYHGLGGASHSNTIHVLHGSVLTNAATNIGNGGNFNAMVVDDSLVVNTYTFANALCVGANGHSNLLVIANNGRYENAGDTRVGNNSSGNTLTLTNATFTSPQQLLIGAANAALDNRVELLPGALLQVPSLAVGNAANSGNHLLLAGGRLEANTLTFNGDNFLAAHIPLDGFPDHAHIRDHVTLPDGLILRPTTVKGAPYGAYPLISSEAGITDEGLVIDAPDAQRSSWRCDIRGNTLRLVYQPPRTLFIIR